MAIMQNGLRLSGSPRAPATAAILSGWGAIPIQTVPTPLDLAARRMFWAAAARSCCHIMGAFILSSAAARTIAIGALPTGPA